LLRSFRRSAIAPIEVQVSVETATQATLRVAVRDTGIGIPKSRQAAIFESFTQADESSSRKYEGAGLGLAISKQIVELLGGEIDVRSDPGRGSTFWFTAVFGRDHSASVASPAAAAPKIAAAPQAIREEVAPTPAQSLRRLSRILLAEDNKVNQRITLRLLEKLGIQADAVINGREAVEALAEHDYDLVLMDCQMPEMDGFEATLAIREKERNGRRTPICALTANSMSSDRDQCLCAGMDDFMSKPIDLEQLQKTIDKWVPHGLAADRRR
jgi:CheY-like chemotaxis protein